MVVLLVLCALLLSQNTYVFGDAVADGACYAIETFVAVAGGARDATKNYVAVAGGHVMPPKLSDAEGFARSAAFAKRRFHKA